jgi:hypothetical protein
MELNWQSKNKIENIKSAIKDNQDLKEIIKKYWGSKNKKDLWLQKFQDNFNSAELTYLDYTENTETNSSNSVSYSEVQETNKITKLDKQETAISAEVEFFKDTENLKALVEIVKKYRSQQENNIQILGNGEISIPDEVKKLELNGNIAVKSNLELYDKIKELAYKNHCGIGQFVTFILWDFLKRNL